eukprot:TRINITY_DN6132_c0_g1_i3.p1 TRINITY_DN6132_c0_g1~~TRINITY_DN6132_c0_g1_i3.p1  ORF type:complete len:372 (+),score=84.89 TRINITY_DN6132_c0_g1_i3:130-1245(+)
MAGYQYTSQAQAQVQEQVDVPGHVEEEKLTVACDTSMGLEPKLLTNILEDYYFKELVKFTTFEELCEEAKKEATHVNAWGGMRGDYKRADNMVIGRRRSECNEHENRSPMKMWCILYRMYQIRLTSDQLKTLLKETSKICLRCMGILYVRFTQPPEDMVDWIQGNLRDTESVVQVCPQGLRTGTSTTLSKLAKNVLLEMNYLDTRFPRIPVKKLQDIRKKLQGEDDYNREAERRSDWVKDSRSKRDERDSTGRDRDRDFGRDRDRDRDYDRKEKKEDEVKKKRRGGRLDLDMLPPRKGVDSDKLRGRERRLEELRSTTKRSDDKRETSRTPTPEPKKDGVKAYDAIRGEALKRTTDSKTSQARAAILKLTR